MASCKKHTRHSTKPISLTIKFHLALLARQFVPATHRPAAENGAKQSAPPHFWSGASSMP
jgi:hypothetical protein